MPTVRRVLRGLSNLSIFPVTTNDGTTYAVGTKISVPGVQSITSTKETENWKIFADDGIYDAGADWKGNSFTLQLADLPHNLRTYFEGGEYDSEAGTYTFKATSEAPEIAMSFVSAANANTNELTKIFSARCTKVSFEHKTKGENDSHVPVKIEGEFMERKTDGAVFAKKDATSSDLTWLETM